MDVNAKNDTDFILYRRNRLIRRSQYARHRSLDPIDRRIGPIDPSCNTIIII